ncbi:MAG: NAD-binding protein [Proteobacteria bacterium]|nr:NAD-binding protein [Pseudomonadota bacterium]
MIAVLVVLIYGTVGYHLVEGWSILDSFWMVFITVTTIGFGEVHPLSDAGRILTLTIIVAGFGVVSYSAGTITRFVAEGGLARELRRRSQEKLMRELYDHFIIVGFGRLGREVAQDLVHANQRVVVIDSEASRVENCEDLGVTAIHGDATHDAVLKMAGISRATGLAVATASNPVNILVTLSARQLATSPERRLTILTRVDEEEAARKAQLAGADGVVSPFGIGGTHMAHRLLRPHSAHFLQLAFARAYGELSMEDVEILDDPDSHGRIGSLRFRERFGVILVAVKKKTGELITAPGPSVEIEQGDVIVVVGRPEQITELVGSLN